MRKFKFPLLYIYRVLPAFEFCLLAVVDKYSVKLFGKDYFALKLAAAILQRYFYNSIRMGNLSIDKFELAEIRLYPHRLETVFAGIHTAYERKQMIVGA